MKIDATFASTGSQTVQFSDIHGERQCTNQVGFVLVLYWLYRRWVHHQQIVPQFDWSFEQCEPASHNDWKAATENTYQDHNNTSSSSYQDSFVYVNQSETLRQKERIQRKYREPPLLLIDRPPGEERKF